MWRETTLLIDRAVQFAIAQTCVCSDSVICLGGISTEPVEAWESKIEWYLETVVCYLGQFLLRPTLVAT